MLSALLAASVIARADEPQEGSSADTCDPKCRAGYACREGTCVQTQCTPQCRSGFLCREGECVSRCNPPCDSQEQCTAEGECRAKPKLSTAPRSRKADPKPSFDNDDDEGSEHRQHRGKPQPTNGRLYLGPKVAGFSAFGQLFWMVGATVAIQASNIAGSPFFLGVRSDLHRFTDGSGWLATLDVDLGARLTMYESTTSAAGLVLGGGVGFGGVWGDGPGFWLFHLPVHIGPFIDAGAFTIEILLGPSLLANKSAFGMFESSIELGARF